MNLDELRAFLAVVETGSLLAASDTLKLSRATLRRRIDELEAFTGTPLLHRTRKGTTVTEPGAILASQGRPLVKEMEALLRAMQEASAEPAGVVRLLMPVGFPPWLVTPLLILLRSRHPRLSVQLVSGSGEQDDIPDDVDAALFFGQEASDPAWTCYPLLHVREQLLASQAYLERMGTPTSLKGLADHTLLSWEGPGCDPRIWPTWNGSSFRVEPGLVSSDIYTIRQCVESGLGLAFMPAPGMEPKAEALVPVLPNLIGRDRVTYLAVPSALSRLPKIRAVVELAQLLGARPGGSSSQHLPAINH